MHEKYDVKITVAKTLSSEEIFGDSTPSGQITKACTRFKVGQEFIVGEDGAMPKGFCTWAWNNIYKEVLTLRYGDNFHWMKEKGTGIFCCTDGRKPVIFELRIGQKHLCYCDT